MRANWDYGTRELWSILGRRALALPAKLLGFKPFCLYLATWLLTAGLITGWIWFAVLVLVLFGIVGLRVLGGFKGES